MPRKVTEQEKIAVSELWNKDYLIIDIANKLGMKKSFVQNLVANHRDICPPRGKDFHERNREKIAKVTNQTRHRKYSREEIDFVLDAVSSGASYAEVAEKSDKTVESVSWIYSFYKTEEMPKVSDRKKWTAEEDEICQRLWNVEGKSLTYIGNVLGRDRSTVSSHMSANRERFQKKGKSVVAQSKLAEKPTPENTVIEYEYVDVPNPEGALLVSFIDLKPRTCKWICSDFWDEYDEETTKCCGLGVLNYKGTNLQKSYCPEHYEAARHKG